MKNKYYLKIFLILLSFIFSTIVLAKTGGSITIVQGPEPVSLDPSIDINKTSINLWEKYKENLNPLIEELNKGEN